MIMGETRRLQGRTSVKTFEKMRMCATSIKSDGTTRGGEGGEDCIHNPINMKREENLSFALNFSPPP